MTFHPKLVHIIFSSVWVAERPSFGKELFTRLTLCSLCILTICNISYFPGFVFWLLESSWSLHTCYLISFLKTSQEIHIPKSICVRCGTMKMESHKRSARTRISLGSEPSLISHPPCAQQVEQTTMTSFLLEINSKNPSKLFSKLVMVESCGQSLNFLSIPRF